MNINFKHPLWINGGLIRWRWSSLSLRWDRWDWQHCRLVWARFLPFCQMLNSALVYSQDEGVYFAIVCWFLSYCLCPRGLCFDWAAQGYFLIQSGRYVGDAVSLGLNSSIELQLLPAIQCPMSLSCLCLLDRLVRVASSTYSSLSPSSSLYQTNWWFLSLFYFAPIRWIGPVAHPSFLYCLYSRFELFGTVILSIIPVGFQTRQSLKM